LIQLCPWSLNETKQAPIKSAADVDPQKKGLLSKLKHAFKDKKDDPTLTNITTMDATWLLEDNFLHEMIHAIDVIATVDAKDGQCYGQLC